MTLPTTIPDLAAGDVGLSTDGLWQSSFRSMASPVRLQQGADSPAPHRRQAEVRALFAEVERQCTRFDPDSDLMRANASADRWQEVGVHCFDALQAAATAHETTGGRFDPRVLDALRRLGYANSLPFTRGDVRTAEPEEESAPAGGRWTPRFDPRTRRVSVGAVPVDLGGIGKGLALRWAAGLLRSAGCSSFLLEAGGDCVYGVGPSGVGPSGVGPSGVGWRLGVEDPAGGSTPVAVLDVADGACATSSVRLRQWQAGERTVHHLIDPRTGQPGGGTLRSVTVVGADPADAEVWSKVLFLAGHDIAEEAGDRGLAALWVDANGSLGISPAMRAHVVWERP
jgi:thiamine biosynthesis lipoprotein